MFLARVVGEKKAREIWYLCRQYSAQEALDMGLVNKVMPLEQLMPEARAWADRMLEMSPTALRFLKASFNQDTDWAYGLQQMGARRGADVLQHGGGTGGRARVQREASAGLLAVPGAVVVMVRIRPVTSSTTTRE